jgi:hypothetical protein
MRVWDVSPGYLNRQSLLGEHRELHGLHNILTLGKRGYSRHPETVRWAGRITALRLRHAHLAAEMRLRGYTDRTPLPLRRRAAWPEGFIDVPSDQFTLLRGKYATREAGRIPLPRSAQELWAHHKYSVLARGQGMYREFGRTVAGLRRGTAFEGLALDLVAALREPPPAGELANALQHMWGHVRRFADPAESHAARSAVARMFSLTQALARLHNEPFLMASTALGELSIHAY